MAGFALYGNLDFDLKAADCDFRLVTSPYEVKEERVGTILAVAIFIVILRFTGSTGVTPIQSLLIAGVTTLLVYPVIADILDGFIRSLMSNALVVVVVLLVVVGLASAGGYVFGLIRSSSPGNPFRPF